MDVLNLTGFAMQWFLISTVNLILIWLREKEDTAKKIRQNNLVIYALCRELLRKRALKRVRVHACWAYKTNGGFWENIVPDFGGRRFQKKFRLSRQSFLDLLAKIQPVIEKRDTQFRMAISPGKRLAITLYALKSGADFSVVADVFGVGQSTVPKIIHQVCEAILEKCFREVIKFPSLPDHFKSVAAGFMDKWQFPNCLGAVDGSHIPVVAPAEHSADYYNYKNWHSTILMGISDSNYK